MTTITTMTTMTTSSPGNDAVASHSTSSQSQAASSFLVEDIRTGFAQQPRRLSPLVLYDALGSALFDAICRLPWYRITRSETGLLHTHAADMIDSWPSPLRLIELGPGNGEKGEYLVRALWERDQAARVELVDISGAALTSAGARLSGWSGVDVHAHEASYIPGLENAAAGASAKERLLVLFLGSNLGNFDSRDAARFLADVRTHLRPGDGLLLGVDLVKSEQELILAYDDPLGVTAAFNKNILVRMNRELDADFDLEAFSHRAIWNEREGRVEMHLVSERDQTVSIPGAEVEATFAPGDFIWTESSYKFTPEGLDDLLASTGFQRERSWSDAEAGFMNALCIAT